MPRRAQRLGNALPRGSIWIIARNSPAVALTYLLGELATSKPKSVHTILFPCTHRILLARFPTFLPGGRESKTLRMHNHLDSPSNQKHPHPQMPIVIRQRGTSRNPSEPQRTFRRKDSAKVETKPRIATNRRTHPSLAAPKDLDLESGAWQERMLLDIAALVLEIH